ncbi:MAG TPA: hypothetical protein VK831_00565, partial [Candidatus Deferrimicrobiaceae bacterium]|nr:hypothetical protein [Candidatus Deferrimicrobiaceae bacterium]
PVAAAIVWFAARRDAAWLVPVGATLAMPALWPVNLTLLVAVIPLLRPGRAARQIANPTGDEVERDIAGELGLSKP